MPSLNEGGPVFSRKYDLLDGRGKTLLLSGIEQFRGIAGHLKKRPGP
jgi:hypothetical protein